MAKVERGERLKGDEIKKKDKVGKCFGRFIRKHPDCIQCFAKDLCDQVTKERRRAGG